MEYINPFSLLDIEPNEERLQDLSWLKKERKKLIARLSLGDSPLLNIKEYELDKSGIIDYFDSLEKENILRWHKEIYLHPPLHDFLVSGNAAQLLQIDSGLWQDVSFRKFVAPYFAYRYSKELLAAIQGHSLERVSDLSQFSMPFDAKWQAKAYDTSYRYLMYYLKEAKSIQRKMDAAKEYMAIVNILPPYFDAIREAYTPYYQEDVYSELLSSGSKWGKKAIGWVIATAAAGLLLWLIL